MILWCPFKKEEKSFQADRRAEGDMVMETGGDATITKECR
jgi:hypothetical protein